MRTLFSNLLTASVSGSIVILAVLVLLLVDILHLSAASYVPFIYFQF